MERKVLVCNETANFIINIDKLKQTDKRTIGICSIYDLVYELSEILNTKHIKRIDNVSVGCLTIYLSSYGYCYKKHEIENMLYDKIPLNVFVNISHYKLMPKQKLKHTIEKEY